MNEPLAERVRPKSLEDYISQQHLVGDKGILTNLIKEGILPSLIFWGPPGIGKTTLANIIANSSDRPFFTLSAITKINPFTKLTTSVINLYYFYRYE